MNPAHGELPSVSAKCRERRIHRALGWEGVSRESEESPGRPNDSTNLVKPPGLGRRPLLSWLGAGTRAAWASGPGPAPESAQSAHPQAAGRAGRDGSRETSRACLLREPRSSALAGRSQLLQALETTRGTPPPHPTASVLERLETEMFLQGARSLRDPGVRNPWPCPAMHAVRVLLWTKLG